MTNYRYRIMQRAVGAEQWVEWMGKVYTDLPAAEHWLARMRELNRFYRWNREYCLQRQPINTPWEPVDA